MAAGLGAKARALGGPICVSDDTMHHLTSDVRQDVSLSQTESGLI